MTENKIKEIPGYDIDKYPDPYKYGPMGAVNLEVGQQVRIVDANGSGNTLEWWVIQEIPNEDGLSHSWFLIGTQHQRRLL